MVVVVEVVEVVEECGWVEERQLELGAMEKCADLVQWKLRG